MLRKYWHCIYFLIVLIVLSVLITACGTGKSTNPNANTGNTQTGNTKNAGKTVGNQGNTSAATALFKQNCVVCHGVNLQGGVGPNLQKIGSSLSKAKITAQITNGGGGMPPFKGKLSVSQINALATWLSSKK